MWENIWGEMEKICSNYPYKNGKMTSIFITTTFKISSAFIQLIKLYIKVCHHYYGSFVRYKFDVFDFIILEM